MELSASLATLRVQHARALSTPSAQCVARLHIHYKIQSSAGECALEPLTGRPATIRVNPVMQHAPYAREVLTLCAACAIPPPTRSGHLRHSVEEYVLV